MKDVPQYGTFSFPAGTIQIEAGGGIGQVYGFKLLRHLFQQASYTGPQTLFYAPTVDGNKAQVYGEPITQGVEGATATPTPTGYLRGSLALLPAKLPATGGDPSSAQNSVAVADFPKALVDWGIFTNMGVLDAQLVTGKTYAQASGVVTVTSAAHGLGATSTLPSLAALGSLSGTFDNAADGTCTITLPIGHGFAATDLACITFNTGPTSARLSVVSSTDTTIVVASGYNTAVTGTVTVTWPLYVDLYFQAVADTGGSTPLFNASGRYLVKAITGTGTFTVDVTTSQTVTTSALAYSSANVYGFMALDTQVTVLNGNTTSIPVGLFKLAVN